DATWLVHDIARRGRFQAESQGARRGTGLRCHDSTRLSPRRSRASTYLEHEQTKVNMLVSTHHGVATTQECQKPIVARSLAREKSIDPQHNSGVARASR